MFANLPINHLQDGEMSWESLEVVSHIEELMNCKWYDWHGLLIIDGPDDIEGPDIDTIPAEAVLIPEALKRFSQEDGFYHA